MPLVDDVRITSTAAPPIVKIESQNPEESQMEADESSPTVIAVENSSPEVIHVVSMTSAPTSVTQSQPQVGSRVYCACGLHDVIMYCAINTA